jgi:Trypsin-like peptidase domain
MKRTFIFALVCILAGVIPVTIEARVLSQPTTAEISQKIRGTAKNITVRVLPAKSPEDGASGILIEKQEQKRGQQSVYLYLVLTNDHVIKILKERATRLSGGYQVETFDNQLHKAFLYQNTDFKKNDLGLLWFSSPNNYQIAEKAKSKKLNEYEKVFVSGFPSEIKPGEEPFKLTLGRAATSFILSGKPLDAGYQLGFSNDTSDGMSGGPVLNETGQLVGINGRGKNQIQIFSADPSFGNSNPYAYFDGTEPPKDIQMFMRHFAWGIPIETYIQLASNKPFDGLHPLSTTEDNQSFTTHRPTSPDDLQVIHQNQNVRKTATNLIPKNIIYGLILLIIIVAIIFFILFFWKPIMANIDLFRTKITSWFPARKDPNVLEHSSQNPNVTISPKDSENFSKAIVNNSEENILVSFSTEELLLQIRFSEEKIFSLLLNQERLHIKSIDNNEPVQTPLNTLNYQPKGQYKWQIKKTDHQTD